MQAAAAGRNGNSSREKSGSPPVSPSFPSHERICGRAILHAAIFCGKELYATPLLVVLLVVETSDILFAVDSIPAVLAITLERLYCLYLERVRHSRPALDVLCAGGHDGPVSLPSLRTVGGADFHRAQNAGVALRLHSHRMGLAIVLFVLGASILASLQLYPQKKLAEIRKRNWPGNPYAMMNVHD
jgi:hypothetical protein